MQIRGIEFARISHPVLNANAWLVMSDTHAVLLDTSSNDSREAERVVEFIRASGRTLQAVILSHGHPDIWLGTRRLREAFPDAPVYVADGALLDDFEAMGNMLVSFGMMPRDCDVAPGVYDYRAGVEVLSSGRLVLQGTPQVTLELKLTDIPSEFTRLTLIAMPEIDVLFVSDLAYHHVHAYVGPGSDRASLDSWLVLLDRTIKELDARTDLVILTGHGPATDVNVLLAQRAYLEELIQQLDSGRSDDEVKAAMIDRFPGYDGRDFQLPMTLQNRAALARPAS